MRNLWKQQSVGDLIVRGVLLINDGYRMRNEELDTSGVPFIRAADISDGVVRVATSDHIAERFTRNLAGKILLPGDVAFIAKGTVGRAGRVLPNSPPFVVAPQVCFWRSLDVNALDPGFLFYLISGREFQNSLDAVKTHGSMVADYVSLSDQRSFRLSVPPVEHQRRIAGVLSSLDAKIELNRQTNETLETMIRTLHRSWFVTFDAAHLWVEGRGPTGPYPAEMDADDLGVLPRGWRRGAFGDIAEAPRRGVQPSEVDPRTAYIGLEHMPRRSIALTEWGEATDVTSGKLSFSRGEILFGKLRPYFHKVGVAPTDGVCSTDILVLTPRRPEMFGLALCHASSDAMITHADATSAGTKMPRTNWGDISRFSIAIPPESVARMFTDMINPLVEQILGNVHESRQLAQMRDLLLPRLLSGDLQVRDAERVVV